MGTAERHYNWCEIKGAPRGWQVCWVMDVPLRATLPLFGVGGLTLILSVIFCCYLWWLRRQGHGDLGYKEIKYKKLKNKSSNEVCPVCLDEFRSGEKIAQCPCKHVFHCKCLLQWLQESNTCPMCKQKVKTEASENTRLMRQEGGLQPLPNPPNPSNANPPQANPPLAGTAEV